MKPLYLLFITFLFCTASIKSQTVIVSGECIAGPITLNPIDSIDGKIAYEGIGTVADSTNVQVDIFWMPAPDNLWVLAFSGQPYFQNSCDSTLPWGTGNAACPWTSVVGQTCSGASPLAVRGAGALLVNFISFTAKADNKQVIVSWKTAGETNNKGFDMQRSPDGITWNNIGFVNGNVNSAIERSYQFSDLKPMPGKNFYRLRQVDLDGKYSYSIVAFINFVKSGFYSISSDPYNGLYTLHLDAGIERVDFSVIDARGRQIMSKTSNGGGDEIIDISNFSRYLLSPDIKRSRFIY